MRKLSVYTEFAQLNDVIVCKPDHFSLGEALNEVERYYYLNDPPRRENLVREHEIWTSTLQHLGVHLTFLEGSDALPQQMFTRDIGFVVGEQMFVSNLEKEVRKGETKALRAFLDEQKISYQNIESGTIEGGDVLIHAPYLFVGIGERTTEAALPELKKKIGKDWKIIPIHLAEGVLHLDCVLSILNEDLIVWCPELITDQHKTLEKLFRHRIAVTKEESFHLAANVLTVNPEHVLVGAKQYRLHEELRNHDIKVHPIDWSEIKKLGGLFRCASCPLS